MAGQQPDNTANVTMRSPLGRVRGLGSARNGVSHWWMQRLTAVGLVPLVLWLTGGLIHHAGAGYEAASAWVSQPLTATALLLLLLTAFYHASLGIQVVLEDYVAVERLRLVCLVAVKLGLTFLAALAVFSVLTIAFG